MRVGMWGESDLEQRINERRDGAGLRENDQQSEQHEHDDDGHEPVFLFLLEKLEELPEDAAFAHFSLRTAASTGVASAAAIRSLPDAVRCILSNDNSGSLTSTAAPRFR